MTASSDAPKTDFANPALSGADAPVGDARRLRREENKRQALQLLAIAAVVAAPPLLALKFGAGAIAIALSLASIGVLISPAGRPAAGRLWAFVRVAFLENHRRRLQYGAFALSWIPGLLAYFFSDADGTLSGRALLVQHWFTVGAMALGSILAALIASQTMPGDFESKRVFMVLTKPAPRWEAVAGKWLGLQLYLGVFLLAAYLLTVLFAAFVSLEAIPSDPKTGQPMYYLDGKLKESVFSARDDAPLLYCGLNPSCAKNIHSKTPAIVPVFLHKLGVNNYKIMFLFTGPPTSVAGKVAFVQIPVSGNKTIGASALFDDRGQAVAVLNVDPEMDWSNVQNPENFQRRYRPLRVTFTDPRQMDVDFTVPWLIASLLYALPASPEGVGAWRMHAAAFGDSAQSLENFMASNKDDQLLAKWTEHVNLNGESLDSILKFMKTQQAAKNVQASWLMDAAAFARFSEYEPLAFRSRLTAMRGMISSYQVNISLVPADKLPGADVAPENIAQMDYQEPAADSTMQVKSREEYLALLDSPAPVSQGVPKVLQMWPDDAFESLAFQPAEGVSAAPKAEPWAVNVFTAYLLIWLELATLAGIVMLWGGAVSFPVAVLLGLVMAVGGQVSGVAVKMADEQFHERASKAETRERIIKNNRQKAVSSRKRFAETKSELNQLIKSLGDKGMSREQIRKDRNVIRLYEDSNKALNEASLYPDPDDPKVDDKQFLMENEDNFYLPFPPSQQYYYRVLKAMVSVPPDFRRYDARGDLKFYRRVPPVRIAEAFIFLFWLQAGILGGAGMFVYYQREISA